MEHFERILVTGGAGFIGSNFTRYLLDRGVESVVVVDKLTYAGNLANLTDLRDHPRFQFIQGDICDAETIERALVGCQAIVNFAAETHVDRSILGAAEFIETNVRGTYVLLEAARRQAIRRFVQVSTDEVYGDVPSGYSRESDPLAPRSPYSASKAAAEMMVSAYVETFGLPALITRGSNTYGPFQYPEKFIPLMITNALDGQPLPVYGDGQQVRDWIHVLDHCSGIDTVLRRGEPGQAYNLAGGNEQRNLDLVHAILRVLDAPQDLVRHVEDRPGHDRRYALATDKLRALGWSPERDFADGLRETVVWYQARRDWWEPIKQGAFRGYYGTNYGARRVLS